MKETMEPSHDAESRPSAEPKEVIVVLETADGLPTPAEEHVMAEYSQQIERIRRELHIDSMDETHYLGARVALGSRQHYIRPGVAPAFFAELQQSAELAAQQLAEGAIDYFGIDLYDFAHSEPVHAARLILACNDTDRTLLSTNEH